jgi:hypothetical protein
MKFLGDPLLWVFLLIFLHYQVTNIHGRIYINQTEEMTIWLSLKAKRCVEVSLLVKYCDWCYIMGRPNSILSFLEKSGFH